MSLGIRSKGVRGLDTFMETILSLLSNEVIAPNIYDVGIAEIIGGWMIWASIRGNLQGKKPWWFVILGSLLLVSYGFIPCLQPVDSFGRIYAIYGGYFILLSFLFGWILDGDKPDLGDVVGGCIAISGAFVIMFWPRAH